MTPNFSVPAELLVALSDYLAKRPYCEVVGFLTAFSKLQPIAEPSAEPEANNTP